MKIKKIVLHHSAINSFETNQFDIINNGGHQYRNWGSFSKPIYAKKSSLGFYVQYHYFIESDGTEKRGRTENEVGWHSGNWEVNNSSLGICLGGNFDEELPKKEQEERLTKRLKGLKLKYPEAEMIDHRDVVPTHCPGIKIPKNWMKNLIFNDKVMFIKKENDNKVYSVVGDNTLIHFNTDGQTFADTFANAVVIEIGRKEFEKFRVITNVSIKK